VNNSIQRGQTATIAINTATSTIVDLHGKFLVGLVMPSGWDAADISFQCALGAEETVGGDTTFNDLYDDAGVRVKVVVTASKHVCFRNDLRSLFRGVRHFKILSANTSGGAPVNQTAARTIIPIVGDD